MNDVDCNQIITADSSLSQLLAFFSLSCISSSMETLFRPFIESKKWVVSARREHFACFVHKAPGQVTLLQGGLEVHKRMQFNNQTLQPAHTVCLQVSILCSQKGKFRLRDLWQNKPLQTVKSLFVPFFVLNCKAVYLFLLSLCMLFNF